MKSSGSCLEYRLDGMIFFKGCPRCHGDIVEKDDVFGWYLSCLQCGSLTDLANLNDETQDTPERDAQIIAA